MQWQQFTAGIAVGLGLAAGSIGGWTAFQQWQLKRSGQSADQATNPATTVSESTQPKLTQTINQNAPASAILPSPAKPLTQAENDYLYDLAQALQTNERAKMDDAARLAMGQTIAGWAEAGADYWDLRQKFAATYAADSFDREVYLKYALERFAPAYIAVLVEPPKPEPTVVQTVEPAQTVESVQTAEPEYSYPIRNEYIHPIQPSDRPEPAPVPEAVPAPGQPPSDTTAGGGLLVPAPSPTEPPNSEPPILESPPAEPPTPNPEPPFASP